MSSFSSMRMSQLSSSSSSLSRTFRNEYAKEEFDKKIQAKTSQAAILRNHLNKTFNSAIKRGENADHMTSNRTLFTLSKQQKIERERDPSVIHFSPTKYDMNITYEPIDTPSQRFTKKWEGFNYDFQKSEDK